MRIIAVLLAPICFGLFFVYGSFASSEVDRARDGLKGSVQAVVLKHTNKGIIYAAKKDVYGPLGNKIEHSSSYYDQKGELEHETRSVYTYDVEGRHISSIVNSKNGTILVTTLFGYDKNENQVASVKYKADGSLARITISTFDDNRREIESVDYYWKPNIEIVRVVYTDDGQGNRSEITYRSGSLERKDVDTMDMQGHRTKRLWYGPDGSLKASWLWHYDNSGNWIKEVALKSDGSVESRMLMKYDGNGNMTEETRYKGNSSPESRLVITYEYDAVGNWIKQTSVIWKGENKKPSDEGYSADRVITYYSTESERLKK